MQSLEVKKIIQSALPDSEVFVAGDDGVHFDAEIISASFIGKSTLERQKIVYQILQPLIQAGQIHAFSMKTFTEDEWEAKL